MKKDNKGFSLVELIIVIAIMAVLVGLLAPQYLKYVNNSKVSTDISNAQEIATAVNVAFADDTYSSQLAGLGSGASFTVGSMPDGSDFPATKLNGKTDWVVACDVNGVVSITVNGGEKIYPDPKDGSNGYYNIHHK